MLEWLCVWVKVRFAYGPADSSTTQSLAPVNPDWFYVPGFTFLVPAHPGSPGQNHNVKQGCNTVECVCVCACMLQDFFYRCTLFQSFFVNCLLCVIISMLIVSQCVIYIFHTVIFNIAIT